MTQDRQEYSDELKAQVMAALLSGQSVSSVANEYDIPRSTVGNWRVKLNQAGVPSVPNTKKEEIGDLLVSYLHANLKALESQTLVFADKAWLHRQSASELAVLHGVMTDKAVRLLEALTRAGSQN